jgi:hypothetical protein
MAKYGAASSGTFGFGGVDMPLYTFLCSACGATATRLRLTDGRDEPYPCRACDTGWMRRSTVEMPAKPVWSMGSDPVVARPIPHGERSSIQITDCSISDCGGGISVGSGADVNVDGLRVTNTPVVFEKERGARIFARNIDVRNTRRRRTKGSA